jgi:hypothetical protein
MIYCITHGKTYHSSFNIFSVIAGIFLITGSLRAVSIVRWFAAFFLSAFISVLLALPLLQPISLTLVEMRLNPPSSSAAALALVAGALLLFWWIIRELNREPVNAAREAAGIRIHRRRWLPIVLGVGLVGVVLIFSHVLSNGSSAERAKQIAHAQLGPGYNYHVTQINIATKNGHTVVSAVVTAWTATEVRQIPVHWEN